MARARNARLAINWPNRKSGAWSPNFDRTCSNWSRIRGSWQRVSDRGEVTQRHLDCPDNLDPNQRTRTELCDPGCPRNAITQHQRTIRAPIDPRRRHAGLAGAEPDELPLDLVGVGRAMTTAWKTKRSGIDVEEFRRQHRLILSDGKGPEQFEHSARSGSLSSADRGNPLATKSLDYNRHVPPSFPDDDPGET